MHGNMDRPQGRAGEWAGGVRAERGEACWRRAVRLGTTCGLPRLPWSYPPSGAASAARRAARNHLPSSLVPRAAGTTVSCPSARNVEALRLGLEEPAKFRLNA